MAGICLLCFVLFPAAILMQAEKRLQPQVLLRKEDSDAIKGIASCFIILTHLLNKIADENAMAKILSLLFSSLGGMGVLLFFFVSGYGIYKGYAQKKPAISFLLKRVLNVYIPCLLIQFIFRTLESMQTGDMDLSDMISRSVTEGWFVYVIFVQYILFFVSWTLSVNKQGRMLMIDFLLSVTAALIFYTAGANARWYNGLLLFPIGMTVACNEKRLLDQIKGKEINFSFVFLVLFTVEGAGFLYLRGGDSAVADILKLLAGTSLSLFVCTIYARIGLNSGLMRYMGRRSLYFYLIHLGLMTVVFGFDGMSGVKGFYIVLLLTFILAELFYALYSLVLRHMTR